MKQDANLSNLLKWSIENSTPSTTPSTTTTTSKSNLTPEVLAALLGGPSDADLMREAMSAIASDSTSADAKEIAWDNFELLLESLDNANNLSALDLWTPLLAQLSAPDADSRRMACWCVGTAVQNNTPAQAKAVECGAVAPLVRLAVGDPSEAVRGKAVRALSSCVRNYQPGLNAALGALPEAIGGAGGTRVDAGDMEAVDGIMARLREASARKGKPDKV